MNLIEIVRSAMHSKPVRWIAETFEVGAAAFALDQMIQSTALAQEPLREDMVIERKFGDTYHLVFPWVGEVPDRVLSDEEVLDAMNKYRVNENVTFVRDLAKIWENKSDVNAALQFIRNQAKDPKTAPYIPREYQALVFESMQGTTRQLKVEVYQQGPTGKQIPVTETWIEGVLRKTERKELEETEDISKTIAIITYIESAVEDYCFHNTSFSADDKPGVMKVALPAGSNAEVIQAIKKWMPNNLNLNPNGEILDAWGRPFRIKCPGPAGKEYDYEVCSSGPDGVANTQDDITRDSKKEYGIKGKLKWPYERDKSKKDLHIEKICSKIAEFLDLSIDEFIHRLYSSARMGDDKSLKEATDPKRRDSLELKWNDECFKGNYKIAWSCYKRAPNKTIEGGYVWYADVLVKSGNKFYNFRLNIADNRFYFSGFDEIDYDDWTANNLKISHQRTVDDIFYNQTEEGKPGRAILMIRDFAKAIEQYVFEYGRAPKGDNSEITKELISRRFISPLSSQVLYLNRDEQLVDSWGNPFEIKMPGTSGEERSFDIASRGEDNILGTKDDIRVRIANWKELGEFIENWRDYINDNI